MVQRLAVIVCFFFVVTASGVVRADIQENQILVIYNSQGSDSNGSGRSDSQDIFEYYKTSRPGVLGFDLDDATLLPGNIGYTDFATKIRDPLREHLTANNLEQQVTVFTLTRGLPHRIQDMNTANLGDLPNIALEQLEDGNASYASVDAELMLLWQSLDEGERGHKMDSHADNVVLNPYHNATTSIADFSREQIAGEKTFRRFGNSSVAWRMSDGPSGPMTNAGGLYLTSRLDGNSVADVMGMIDRGRHPSYNQFDDMILIDENSKGSLDDHQFLGNDDTGYLGDDYDETAEQLAPKYSNLLFDESSLFFVGAGDGFTGNAETEVVNDDVAALVSFGGNHGSNNSGFVESFGGQLSNGAIMNTMESFNAKMLGGLDGYADQGQLATFVEVGGTFGIGSTAEPFAFSVPDNEALLENFLFGGLTWVEAAWSSVPWLSWQQLVIGDPLATATLILDPQVGVWTGDQPFGEPGDTVSWSDANNWTRGSVPDRAFQDGDAVVLLAGTSRRTIDLEEDRIVESIVFGDGYTLNNATLVIRSGDATVGGVSVVTINSDIAGSKGLHKLGVGTLLVNGRAPATSVRQGRFGGSGELAGLDVISSATVSPGREDAAGTLTVTGNYVQGPGATLDIELDGTTIASDLLAIGGTARLDGSLALLPVNQYTPPTERGARDEFTVLSADMIEGHFAVVTYNEVDLAPVEQSENSFTSHMGEGLFHEVTYSDTEVGFSSYLAIPGDANGDTLVDAADLNIWSEHRFTAGTDWTSGDFNGDGATDGADFHIWNDSLELARAQQQMGVIPEPSGLQMAIVLVWGAIFCFPRRNRSSSR